MKPLLFGLFIFGVSFAGVSAHAQMAKVISSDEQPEHVALTKSLKKLAALNAPSAADTAFANKVCPKVQKQFLWWHYTAYKNDDVLDVKPELQDYCLNMK